MYDHPQNHGRTFSQALKLLERYFGVEDEEDTGIAPALDDGAQQFSFGQQPPPQGADTAFGAPPAKGGFNFT